jgi:hypothetical protein
MVISQAAHCPAEKAGEGSKPMNYPLDNIFENFSHKGTYAQGSAYGNGHINDTFQILTRETSAPDYILQRINGQIFKNPKGLLENIERVTNHIRTKLPEGMNREMRVLTLTPTKDGKVYFIDEEGNFWRLYLFIGPNHSYDLVPNADVAYQGGLAFGRFQRYLSDLPGSELHETIPDFHNMVKRLKTFYEAVKEDKAGRVSQSTKEIEFVRSRKEVMSTIFNMGEQGLLPLRVTHNDTKFNNVLLDTNDQQLCVIDLDTVMPGYIHYDFGDTIRTATNRGEEDEQDLSKVYCDREILTGFARGFLKETASILTKTEMETLYLAGKTMTFLIGLRFLTDHIQGDTYFKIHRENHNLHRCRAQFKLVESLEEQEDSLKEIIESLVESFT